MSALCQFEKKGKLPFTTVEETYELEYGSATVELHTDAVKAGDRVLLIDDLIATGGTMMAGKKLLEKLGAHVMEGAAIVDGPINSEQRVYLFSHCFTSKEINNGLRVSVNHHIG